MEGGTKPKARTSGCPVSDAKRRNHSDAPPPINGGRPITTFEISVNGVNQFVPIKVLSDSEATVFNLSGEAVSRLRDPKVERDVPITVSDFAGNKIDGVGKAFMLPLILKHANHYSKES